MTTIPINNQSQLLNTEDHSKAIPKSNLFERYLSYVDSQENQYIFWFMTAILVIPCVLMTLSIIVMFLYSNVLEYYIGFAMILFFANVLVHLSGMKARVYLPVFHITAILMIMIPLITYLISMV